MVPFNQYQFDYNQFESVTILSGATAKALYGPRASIGAVYVTTKKGSWNKPLSIHADVRAGFDFVDRQPEWVDAYEYAVLNNEARAADGYPVLYDNEALAGYAKGDPFSRKYPAVDYRSFMLRKMKTNQNFLFGANLLNLHGLYYTTYGGYWEWAPPCYHFRMPYWKHMDVFLKYYERLSYVLSQGTWQAEVAIIYPVAPYYAGLQANQSEATSAAFNLAISAVSVTLLCGYEPNSIISPTA